jgi:AcrR family transcriptional regulator
MPAPGQRASVFYTEAPSVSQVEVYDFVMTDQPARRPRVDAERNRERLLVTAKETFAKHGTGTSLEEIARETGVGIGTLYRHFPTRDALVAAVYRNETQQLAGAASTLSSVHPPLAALEMWLNLFVDYMATKRGLHAVLDSLASGTSALYADSAEQMTTALRMLMDRAVASGEANVDVDALDLLRAVAGVSQGGAGDDWVVNAKKVAAMDPWRDVPLEEAGRGGSSGLFRSDRQSVPIRGSSLAKAVFASPAWMPVERGRLAHPVRAAPPLAAPPARPSPPGC